MTELTPLEIATGAPIGFEPCPPLPRRRDETPIAALEAVLREALGRGPLVVSFSGGLDSSLVLRVAARVAAAEGLQAPVAHTLRYPQLPETDETAWQELAIRGLRVGDWVRHEVEPGELDAVGPRATAVLRTVGLSWPPNLHFGAPAAAAASGGTVAYGVDGDGLLDLWRWARVLGFLRRRARPRRRDLRDVALALAPVPLRRRMIAARPGFERQPWLADAAWRAVVEAHAEQEAREPLLWNRRVPRYASARYLQVMRRGLGAMAAAEGAQLALPLADPRLLAAVARAGGAWGMPSRPLALRAWFPGELPEALLRRGKVFFDRALCAEPTHTFAESWDGSGVPEELVEPALLRREWLGDEPDVMSTTLLQAAWLAGQPDSAATSSKCSSTRSSSSSP